MKRIFYSLGLSFLLILGFTGCSKQETKPVTEDIEAKTIQIETPYGNLSYPKKYEEYLKTAEQEENGVYRLVFSTDINDRNYELFTVVINGDEDGIHLGQIKDKDGSEKDVYVKANDLGDLSDLSQDEQDQIYGMQEALNDLLGVD